VSWAGLAIPCDQVTWLWLRARGYSVQKHPQCIGQAAVKKKHRVWSSSLVIMFRPDAARTRTATGRGRAASTVVIRNCQRCGIGVLA
jgi:hypothetical protein